MDVEAARRHLHELSNSLATVLGTAELLVAQLPQDGQPARDAIEILNAATRGREQLHALAAVVKDQA